MIDGKHILCSKIVSEISISLHPQFKNILPSRNGNVLLFPVSGLIYALILSQA